MALSAEISLEVIAWGSPAYEQAVELRDEVLRKPLGMSIYSDNLAAEKDDIHLLARLGTEAIGVLLLRQAEEAVLQMKQVAVKEGLQGKGVGRLLVAYAEQVAKAQGTRKLILHARMTAVPFYEKMGYSIYGEAYNEIGIPHRSMEKFFD